jgi:hypothetical protein
VFMCKTRARAYAWYRFFCARDEMYREMYQTQVQFTFDIKFDIYRILPSYFYVHVLSGTQMLPDVSSCHLRQVNLNTSLNMRSKYMRGVTPKVER